MSELDNIKRELYAKDELVIWNKFKRWGDENDKHMRIIFGNYSDLEHEIIYSGKLLQEIEVNSKGIQHILAPLKDIEEIPQSQLIRISSYYNLVGMKKI